MFFPDSLVRFVRAEFEMLQIMRVPGHRALKELVSVDRVPQLCILEEGFATGTGADLDRTIEAGGGSPAALAYYRTETARQLFTQARSGAPRRLGYIPMRAHMNVWLAALRIQLCGERFVPSELLGTPQPHATEQSGPAGPLHARDDAPVDPPEAPLTERELQVLELVSDGKQNKLIASELGLSEHTVKLHVHHVLTKLKVRNRTGATTWFVRNRGRLDLSGGLNG